jgi:mono/diheme cytochrome c family protein
VSGSRWSLKPVFVVLGAVVLLGVGVLIGVLVKDGEQSDSQDGALTAAGIGDASRGRQLFVSQGCASCHSYEGRGGADAPELDFMRGRLTATEIAGMTGTIWNHVPVMEAAFEAEEIPFPTFEADQMADLIAYLHGGGAPPNAPTTAESEAEEDEEGGMMHESGEAVHESGEAMHGDGDR